MNGGTRVSFGKRRMSSADVKRVRTGVEPAGSLPSKDADS